MRKLLRANFDRIKKSKVFWAEFILLLLFGLAILVDNYRMSFEFGVPRADVLAECLFQSVLLSGIFFAVFCSLFVGTEYDEGTIRNKLVIGCSRVSIYFSNVISILAAVVFQSAAAVGAVLAVGVVLCGKPNMETAHFFQLCAALLFLCMAYASIYNLCAMLINSKSYASTANILLAFALLFLAAFLIMKLDEPEMITQFEMTVDGMPAFGDKTPNPNYVSGQKRAIYQFLFDFLPGGQSYQIGNSSMQVQLLKHPALSCVYSLIITLAANAAGIFLFRRKDIK